ncbi:MAG: YlzJ-like family protein [Bacillus sp. (in: Bacteria)]|nr:YlzJ-like family protein [Bacillus sp. (in: firmicutes)]
MILYTYQSQETMFPVNEQDFTKQQLVDIPGGQLVLEREEGDMGGVNYRIVRLLSTDPNLYMDQRYTPGQYFQL